MSVLMFMPIAKLLDRDQPAYGIQPKSLHKIDYPMLTMEEIAAEYIQELLEKLPNDKYALAGYSFGGFVAFEMAKQLRSMGKTVTMLAMFDCNAETGYFHEDVSKSIFRKVIRQFPKMLFIGKTFIKYPVDTISYQGFFLKNKWIEITGQTQYQEEDEASKKIALLDLRYEYALEHYKMGLSTNDIDLFRVKKRIYFVPDQNYLGWREHTMKNVFVHPVPGDHKTFLMHPNQQAFAEMLQSILNKKN
jgi:thioesterase domain-containing protein